MFFFTRSKKIKLDCFTSRSDIYNFFPIDYANKFYPDWWKKLPESYSSTSQFAPKPTMKGCPGFTSFFSSGVTIPLWCDLLLDSQNQHKKIGWQLSDLRSSAREHEFEQMTGYVDPEKFGHLKLNSPWIINCKEDVNWAFVHNTWNLKQPDSIIIPPGVVNYKYMGSSNINLFFNRNNYGRVIVECGTPLVNLIPMSDKKVQLQNHLVTAEELTRIQEKRPLFFYFSNRYNKTKILHKNLEKKSKCPFGFSA